MSSETDLSTYEAKCQCGRVVSRELRRPHPQAISQPHLWIRCADCGEIVLGHRELPDGRTNYVREACDWLVDAEKVDCVFPEASGGVL